MMKCNQPARTLQQAITGIKGLGMTDDKMKSSLTDPIHAGNRRSIAQLHSAGICLLASLFLLAVSQAKAQFPQPRLYAIFPAGAQAGTETSLSTTSSADLDDTTHLLFSHPGITAVPKKQTVNGFEESVANQFIVKVNPDVPAGYYEVTASGPFGISNSRLFMVSHQKEINEAEPNQSTEEANAFEINQIVNGTINGAGDVDQFQFEGKKGQRVLITAYAHRIDSRLNAAVEVWNQKGRRIGYSKDDYKKDPLIDLILEADGKYFVKIFDFTYRGGGDYPYRLTASTAPHVDYVLPPVATPGQKNQLTFYGRNLPGGTPAGVEIEGKPIEKLTVEVDAPSDPSMLEVGHRISPTGTFIDGFFHTINSPSGASNPVLIQFASDNPVAEVEPNPNLGQSQKINVPVDLYGQFAAQGDVDSYIFEAKAKEVYEIELISHRSGSTADPQLALNQLIKDKDGKITQKRIVEKDDDPTNLAPGIYESQNNDFIYRFTVPADGSYQLLLRDRYFEIRGDPRLVYRVIIRKPSPDFRLVAIPYAPVQGTIKALAGSNLLLRQGGTISVKVNLYRKDGFTQDVLVTAEGLPEGVVCHGVVFSGGTTQADLVFSATEEAKGWEGPVRIVGQAKLENPQKVQAVNQVTAELAQARQKFAETEKSLPALQKSVDETNAALQKSISDAKVNPDDKNLQTALITALKNASTSEKTLKAAQDQLTSGKQAIADKEAQLKKAKEDQIAAIETRQRVARTGTVVWEPGSELPVINRLGQNLLLSVLNEKSPYNLDIKEREIVVNQGRQILIPVDVTKRNGFDNELTLADTGNPDAKKIIVTNPKVAKGQNQQTIKIFVNPDAPMGTFNLLWNSQGTVAYQRNPGKTAREKEKLDQVVAKVTEIEKQVASVTAELEKSKVTVETAKASLDKMTTEKTGLEKETASIKSEMDTVNMKVTALENVNNQLASAFKQVEQSAPNLKNFSSQDKELAGLFAEVESLQKQMSTVNAKMAEKKESLTRSLQALDEDRKAKLAKVTELNNLLAKNKTDYDKAVAVVSEKDASLKKMQEDLKAKQAQKAAIDKTYKAAAEQSKPKNITTFIPSVPIRLVVKKAPVKLTAAVPDGGKLKKGSSFDVKVTVARDSGFTAPIKVNLDNPSGFKGLSASEITIPEGQNEGIIKITSAPDASEGAVANLVLRASMEYDGQAIVDVPVALTVIK